jgi:hypothetical protein
MANGITPKARKGRVFPESATDFVNPTMDDVDAFETVTLVPVGSVPAKDTCIGSDEPERDTETVCSIGITGWPIGNTKLLTDIAALFIDIEV